MTSEGAYDMVSRYSILISNKKEEILAVAKLCYLDSILIIIIFVLYRQLKGSIGGH